MTSVDADRDRLLRIAHAGLLAWWDGPAGLELVSITDWEPLTWEDSDLASRLCQGPDPLLTEGRKVGGVTRIGITQRGEHVLAGDGPALPSNPVVAAIRRRLRQPLRDDDPDLLAGYSGEDPDPELTRDMAAAFAAELILADLLLIALGWGVWVAIRCLS